MRLHSHAGQRHVIGIDLARSFCKCNGLGGPFKPAVGLSGQGISGLGCGEGGGSVLAELYIPGELIGGYHPGEDEGHFVAVGAHGAWAEGG